MHKAFLVATWVFTAVAASGLRPTVNINNGTVVGVDLPQFGQSLFLGIPYAQPPVGDLRLRPPRSINTSFGQLDASAYGPHCWSAFTTGIDDNTPFNNSEDCLTLNVIRPHGLFENTPVPVLVWIHGGGLTTGGSADLRYNGTYLVQASVANGNPIIFVSINYRLASLGFLGGKALAEEGSLNLGLRDQRLALHWVQENIANFGGDPKKVTIHGESVWFKIVLHVLSHVDLCLTVGGSSVHAQIIAYAGRDDKLFNQAIVQSDTWNGNFSLPDASIYQATYDSLLAETNCTNSSGSAQLSCIRTLPIDRFRQSSVGVTGMLFDGDFLNVPGVMPAYRAGNWVKVPFLVGSNTDEGRTFAPSGANTTADVEAIMGLLVPAEHISEALELYPDVPGLGCPFNTGDFQLDPVQNGIFATPGAQNKRVAAFVGDVLTAAGPRWLAQEISSQVPFWKYRFNHQPYAVTFGVEDYIGHFVEVAYVFNSQNNDTDFWIKNQFHATYLGAGAPIADRFLGVSMSRAWASFAATGDPNNANVSSKLHWPKYSEGGENMVWQTQGSVIEKDKFREEGMKFIMDKVFF
ncbi:Carboxylic ester hydrolase [Mycena venus]|uniref:Carboxylic ester hydrolase n=1 Tax=Mycena venus TaxID=2733690 RepID=A0A8H7CYG5_9AGAR|nr:Carboxylic ester hydrolase [Mycena venus]